MDAISKKKRVQVKAMICAMMIFGFLASVLSVVLRGGEERGKEVTERYVQEDEKERPEAFRANDFEKIRVLLKTSGFESIFHQEIILRGIDQLCLVYGGDGMEREICVPAGEKIVLNIDSTYFKEDGKILIRGRDDRMTYVDNLRRSVGAPGYYGSFEVISTPKGLVLINEVQLEKYLYSVIPSEMPSDYPAEALKAQAICARTYAMGKILDPGYPEYRAHLDDSTAYQVYGNVMPVAESTKAVEETKGEILLAAEGNLAETYYYSTSCGRGTSADIWGEGMDGGLDGGSKLTYLSGKLINKKEMEGWRMGALRHVFGAEDAFLLEEGEDDYEKEEPWYRWTYAVEKLDLKELAARMRECLPGELSLEFSEVTDLNVTRRGTGGVVTALLIKTDGGEYEIRGADRVRRVLCDGRTKALKKDGTESVCASLLPSAFFQIRIGTEDGNVVGYTINGGGYGHGVGMSQAAAGKMALEGYPAEEILGFFYEGCRLRVMP